MVNLVIVNIFMYVGHAISNKKVGLNFGVWFGIRSLREFV